MGMWITVNVSFKRDRFSEQDFIFGACNCEVQPCQNNESFFFGCYFEGSTISQTNFIAHIIVGMEKINEKFQTCPPLFNVATFPIPTLPHLHPSPHLFYPLIFFFLHIINLFVSIRGIKVNLYNLYFLLFYFSSQPNKNVFYPSTFLLLNHIP